MSIFKKISSIFSGGGGSNRNDYMVYVQCRRCKEYLSTRLFLNRDLSEKDEGGYITQKTLVGTGASRCFQRIEVTLHFDDRKNLIDQEITGGTFVSVEDYEAGTTA
ncbi:MAG: hypothetical protein AAF629_25450 [Chloroflexota bacterium]